LFIAITKLYLCFMLQTTHQAIQFRNSALQDAYKKYGGMLYGYLLSVLKDEAKAEQFLVNIFDDLAKAVDETGECGPYTWCGLYRTAKSKLIHLLNDEAEADHNLLVFALGRKMYEEMSDLQRQVFYEAYYNGKMINELAVKLNQSDELIRKALKEAFLILRRGGN
jgi:DNA-directed RNA polymerase specialized sigma24 family protein